MKRFVAAAVLSLILASLPARARVVLVGIDGGSWPLIDRGIVQGKLPNLAALARDGVTAELSTVEPVNSPTVWTSIATGRSPEHHGVTDFFRNRTHVATPTVFERLAARGLRVGLYDYLITWPPRTLPKGFMIPGWLRRSDEVRPPDVYRRAGLTPYVWSVKEARTPADFAERARHEGRKKAPRFNQLAEAFDLDLGAVSFYSLDASGHRFWRAAHPDEFDEPSPAREEPFRRVIPDALEGIDHAVGEIRGALTAADSLVVVSDHGFQAADGMRRVWSTDLAPQLAASGLLPESDCFTVDGEFFAVALRVHPGPFEKREAVLERLRGIVTSARSEAGEPLFRVDVVDKAQRPPAARRSLWERVYQWGFELALTYLMDLRLDRPAFAFVFARPDDDVLHALWPDGRVVIDGRSLAAGELFHLDEFSGTHDPTGIFLAAGGPLRPLPERGELSVLDVAPLLFYLAGAPVPDDLEGRVPLDWIEPGFVGDHPVQIVPAGSMAGLPPEKAASDMDDEVLIERLRALGYVK